MGNLNRVTVLVGVLAVLMLSVAAVTITSRVTSAGSPTPTTTESATEPATQPTTQPATLDCAANQADDATETKEAVDTDQVDMQCGPQDAADASGAADAADAAGGTDAADAAGTADAADAPGADGESNDAIEQQATPAAN